MLRVCQRKSNPEKLLENEDGCYPTLDDNHGMLSNSQLWLETCYPIVMKVFSSLNINFFFLVLQYHEVIILLTIEMFLVLVILSGKLFWDTPSVNNFFTVYVNIFLIYKYLGI